MVTAAAITAEQLWTWLEEIPDPEIPVLSILDLGIVRRIEHDAAAGEWVITITPTYSGCPAMDVIARDIKASVAQHGAGECRIQTQLAPVWTTAWMTEKGRASLAKFGIAPPSQQLVQLGSPRPASLVCPQCGSNDVRLLSQHGSTACKALYKCNACLEPFDYFKHH